MVDLERIATSGVEDWAGERGERWLAELDLFEAMLAPIGEALIARAGLVAGETVADIGCGGGWTTRRIARAVSPGGSATGIDVAASLVAEARRRAMAEGLVNCSFLLADAAALPRPELPFDRILSRFGVMFFADPGAGFINLARLLRPGGRLDMAVWADPADNPWMLELRRVVGRHVPLAPVDPRAPGPFQLADQAFLRDVLAIAGFGAVAIDSLRLDLALGGPGAAPGEAADFAMRAFAFAEVLATVPPDVHAAVRAELEALYAGHNDGGGVRMPAAVWLVTAHGPA